MELQFGYGSNMHPKRLEKKEGIENILTTARRAKLYNWKFGFTKKGDDGSGKANIIPSDGEIEENARSRSAKLRIIQKL